MSPFVYGTMRMNEKKYSFNEWVDFFKYLYFDLKINWLHTSYEYCSFDLMCNILKRLKNEVGVNFKYIVKLGEPHFEDQDFCYLRLGEKIAIYKTKLSIKTIDIVQWMWRSQLGNEERRVKLFSKNSTLISDQFNYYKKKGIVNKFYCFPYTIEFAENARKLNFFDGYIIYRNLYENEYDLFIDKLDKDQVISIRPFFSGKGFKDAKTFNEMINYNINHPAINKVIMTVTKYDHLKKVNNYLDKISF